LYELYDLDVDYQSRFSEIPNPELAEGEEILSSTAVLATNKREIRESEKPSPDSCSFAKFAAELFTLPALTIRAKAKRR
jgi:hypothetical protein